MGRPRHKWRTLKWAGLIASLVIFVLLAVSLVSQIGYARNTRPSHCAVIVISSGYIAGGELPIPSPYDGWHMKHSKPDFLTYTRNQIRFAVSKGMMPFSPNPYVLAVPLSTLLLLFATATAFLWWLDRRRIPLGHCRNCEYNLTGNISGICPECGEAICSTMKGDA